MAFAKVNMKFILAFSTLLVSSTLAHDDYWFNRAGEYVPGDWYLKWSESQGYWDKEGSFNVDYGTGPSKDGMKLVSNF